MKEPLTLRWNGQSLGEIRDARLTDWPWWHGKFTIGEFPAILQNAIEWMKEQHDSDGDGPPENLLEGWSLLTADGQELAIGVPVVDFKAATIEWA